MSYQTSAAQGLLRPNTFAQPPKSTRDVGTDAPDNEFLQNLVKEFQAFKKYFKKHSNQFIIQRYETKATNTTIDIPKEELRNDFRPEYKSSMHFASDPSARPNFLANFSSNPEPSKNILQAKEIYDSQFQPTEFEKPSWPRFGSVKEVAETNPPENRPHFEEAEQNFKRFCSHPQPTEFEKPSWPRFGSVREVAETNPPENRRHFEEVEQNLNQFSINRFAPNTQYQRKELNDITNTSEVNEKLHQYPNRPAELEIPRNVFPSFPKNPHTQLDISPISGHDISKKENNYDSPLFDKNMIIMNKNENIEETRSTEQPVCF